MGIDIPVEFEPETTDFNQQVADIEAADYAARFGIVLPAAEVRETQDTLDETGEPRTVTYGTEAPDAAATNTQLDNVGKGLFSRLWPGGGRVATYRTEAPGAGALNTILNGVAKPRTARINIDTQPDVFDVNHALDVAARNRTSTITINTVGGGGGGGGAGGGPDDFGVDTLAAPGVTALTDVTVTPLAGDTIGASYATPVGYPGGATTSTSTVTHNHVTIQAAVIGSRFDVQRAVSKALRQAQRLNGTRAA